MKKTQITLTIWEGVPSATMGRVFHAQSCMNHLRLLNENNAPSCFIDNEVDNLVDALLDICEKDGLKGLALV